MSRIVIVILVYHRHKAIDRIFSGLSYTPALRQRYCMQMNVGSLTL
jgi:hypothetical protein